MTAGYTAPLFSVELAGVRPAVLVVAADIAAAIRAAEDAEVIKVERSGDIDAIEAHALPLPFFLVTPVDGLSMGVAATTAVRALELARHRLPDLEVQRIEQCGTLAAVPPDCPAIVHEAPTGASAFFEAAADQPAEVEAARWFERVRLGSGRESVAQLAAALAGHPDPVPLIGEMKEPPTRCNAWVGPSQIPCALQRGHVGDCQIKGQEVLERRLEPLTTDGANDQNGASPVVAIRRAISQFWNADGQAHRGAMSDGIHRGIATLEEVVRQLAAASVAATATTTAAAQALEGVRAVVDVPASMPPHEVPAWVSSYALGARGVPRTRAGDLQRMVDEARERERLGQQPTDQTAEECGVNAPKWAAAFCEANPHPDPSALRALMAGWFALAIQRALDLAGKARWRGGLGPQEGECTVDPSLTNEEREELRRARADLDDANRKWDADVDKCGSAISFLMGVLDRVRRSTTLSAAWSYAAAGEDRITRWHLGTWQPGPHDDPAQWAGVKLTTPGPVTGFETAGDTRIADRVALANSLAGAVREALKVPPSVADVDLPAWVVDWAGCDAAALDALTRSLAEALGCEAHPITVQERVLDLAAPPSSVVARATLADALIAAIRQALHAPDDVPDDGLPGWLHWLPAGWTPSPAQQAMISGLARAAARYEQTGLMVRGDGSLWDDDMRNALAAAREAGLAPPPSPLDPGAARALWVPPDAVVLTDADADAFREFQRASIAMEDAHRAYADRQREHSAAMVTLGRAAAASGRAVGTTGPAR